jgi:hypothetical protein
MVIETEVSKSLFRGAGGVAEKGSICYEIP